jgi:hypothetical protein
MRRVTVTIPDDLERALVEFQESQPVPPTITAIAQAALRQFLAQRTIQPARRPLHFTAIDSDEGPQDLSVNHDEIVVEATEG